MGGIYARDINIGGARKPTIETQLETLTAKVDTLASKDTVEEVLEELKKVSLGAGLVTGTDLNEENADA